MRWMMVLGLGLLLGGCAPKPILEKPFVQVRLEAVEVAPVGQGKVAKVLQVRPVSGNLDTTKLVYQSADGITQAYAYHRWEEPLARQMQRLLAAALAKSEQFDDVLSTASIARPQLILETTALAFDQQLQDNKNSYVRLHVRMRVVDVQHKESLAHRFFALEVPVETQTPAGALRAYNAVFAQWVAHVSAWLVELGEAHAL